MRGLIACTSVLWFATAACADAPYVVVLGTAQDAGYPQAGCRKDCCRKVWQNHAARRFPSCLAVVDPDSNQRWLLDCTPAFPDQLQLLADTAGPGPLTGILPTHAHIGHYTGLMHLGREVMGARDVPVYVMPRMRHFLIRNGPWDQLVRLKNIELRPLAEDEPLRLNDRINVLPIQVPHRDEYSETVAFLVRGPRRAVLYLPDIDKWDRWSMRIETWLEQVDRAYLDGTFFAAGEIPGRDIAEIPHPFISESIARFGGLPAAQRAKIRFIHLNHTNPALDRQSAAHEQIRDAGLDTARQGARFGL